MDKRRWERWRDEGKKRKGQKERGRKEVKKKDRRKRIKKGGSRDWKRRRRRNGKTKQMGRIEFGNVREMDFLVLHVRDENL